MPAPSLNITTLYQDSEHGTVIARSFISTFRHSYRSKASTQLLYSNIKIYETYAAPSRQQTHADFLVGLLRLWRWRWYVPAKRRLTFSGQCGVISWKAEFFLRLTFVRYSIFWLPITPIQFARELRWLWWCRCTEKTQICNISFKWPSNNEVNISCESTLLSLNIVVSHLVPSIDRNIN
jgi:hypothetical protein